MSSPKETLQGVTAESNRRILFNEVKRLVQRVGQLERDLVLAQVMLDSHEDDYGRVQKALQEIRDELEQQRNLASECWREIRKLKETR